MQQVTSQPFTITKEPSGINQNLLLDTSFLSDRNMGAWHTRNGVISPQTHLGRNVYSGTNTYTNSTLILLSQAFNMSATTWYTLSFWLKSTGQVATGILAPDSSNPPSLDSEFYVDGNQSINTGIGSYPKGTIIWDASPNWTYHTFSFRNPTSYTNGATVNFGIEPGKTASVCMIKLEVGMEATAYLPNDGDALNRPGVTYGVTNRHAYSSTAVYYGSPEARDAVKINGLYYIAKSDAGRFTAISPLDPSQDKWDEFDFNIDDAAIIFLLAEEANIAGFIFRNHKLISQDCDEYGNPNVELDGINGRIKALKGVFAGQIQYPFAPMLAKTGAVFMNVVSTSQANVFNLRDGVYNLSYIDVSKPRETAGYTLQLPTSISYSGALVTIYAYSSRSDNAPLTIETDSGCLLRQSISGDYHQEHTSVVFRSGYIQLLAVPASSGNGSVKWLMTNSYLNNPSFS